VASTHPRVRTHTLTKCARVHNAAGGPALGIICLCARSGLLHRDGGGVKGQGELAFLNRGAGRARHFVEIAVPR
jgi:hypothetical protein